MRLPILYIFSASLAGIGIALGLYIIWHSYSSNRLVLSHFPDYAPQVERAPASASPEYYAYAQSDTVPPVLFSLGEVLANVSEPGTRVNHFARLRLDFELFDEGGRRLMEEGEAGIKHTVIEILRDQSFGRLNTLDGKLYFKEELVARINSLLNQPVIRQVHFASFYLQ
ncbi:MAG: flagellar basal body-associated FliL family protein [Bdellovibrionales bacterium]|nr:flagellar basal body-associated FliL family protein [Bdellovibrionales bacterium]